MLAIKSRTRQKCTPNLLPARSLQGVPDALLGKSHAYFRGRHLHGTAVPVPTGYTGAVLRMTKEPAQPPQSADRDHADEDGDDDQMMVDTETAEHMASFDEVVVWGHASEVDGGQDAYIRGIREWVGFAEAIHTHEEDNAKDKKG
jgi:ribonuclease H2 subunit C